MLSRKYKVCIAGRTKAVAQRIRRDAERIAASLAAHEKVKDLAGEYDCDTVTFAKNVTAVIGAERWRQLVPRRGPKPGHGARGPRLQDAPPVETGPHCHHCTSPITPDTRKCTYCGTLR
jgi:hypothetical protein